MVEPLGKKIKRIAWGITGSGDQMIETYSVLVDVKEKTGVDTMVFLSKEGETVMKWYHLWDKIQDDFPNFKVDAGPNSPFIAVSPSLERKTIVSTPVFSLTSTRTL